MHLGRVCHDQPGVTCTVAWPRASEASQGRPQGYVGLPRDRRGHWAHGWHGEGASSRPPSSGRTSLGGSTPVGAGGHQHLGADTCRGSAAGLGTGRHRAVHPAGWRELEQVPSWAEFPEPNQDGRWNRSEVDDWWQAHLDRRDGRWDSQDIATALNLSWENCACLPPPRHPSAT